MSIDFTYFPTVLNARYVDAIGGECTFTIVGAEVYTTQDGKDLKCLQLQTEDDDIILFNPNATNRLKLNEAGLRNSDEMIGYRLVLHTVVVSLGNEDKRGVRIREILTPLSKVI
jgi:hypothetical protein